MILREFFVELNPRKKKWFLFGSYHPPSQSDEYFFDQVKKYVQQIL